MTEDTFISHLIELRDRLLRSLIAVGIVFGLLCIYPGPGAIYDLLALPLTQELPEGTKMIATSVITPFLVPIKVTVMVAFMIALPYVLYQVWAFVAPGLYAHEKRLVLPLVFSSTVLFLIGVAFCYFIVFGQVFRFICRVCPEPASPRPRTSSSIFRSSSPCSSHSASPSKLPVALIVLVRMGVVSVEKLREFRGYFVVGAAVAAAVVTPPDVVSMLALLLPMWLLYELGIIIATFVSKAAPRDSDEDYSPLSEIEKKE